jgi:hypothetical protein
VFSGCIGSVLGFFGGSDVSTAVPTGRASFEMDEIMASDAQLSPRVAYGVGVLHKSLVIHFGLARVRTLGRIDCRSMSTTSS